MGIEQNNPAKLAAIKRARIIMEDPAIQRAVSIMEWEGAPLQGIVEVGSDPTTHPLRNDRIRPTASEVAETVDPTGQPNR